MQDNIKKIQLTEKNDEFTRLVNELSGQIVTVCDQCGTCSGSCPMALEMDITPATLMRMSQLGQREVMESRAMWLCAACFTCTSRCPRGLDLAKVAEALRQIKLRDAIRHVDLKKIPKEDLATLPPIALISCSQKFT